MEKEIKLATNGFLHLFIALVLLSNKNKLMS